MTQAPAIQRKLTTILAADAANFSGLMARDEVSTVQALRKSRIIFEQGITSRGGRIANTAGDGLIAEFPSVVEAVAAAVTIQQKLAKDPELLPFRIGLHLGDVIVEGEDLLGDGVNLAARLQEMAPEGGVLVSRQIVDQARGRLSAEFRPLSPTTPKHMLEEIEVYGVLADGLVEPGDLADVLPKSNVRQDVKRNEFLTFRNRILGLCAFLIVIDILTGPGSFWALIPVAALLFALWNRWKSID